MSNAERKFLNSLSKFENIPRKKAKFLNFVRSALSHKTIPAVVESVWNKMETAYKNNLQATTEKQQQDNGKSNLLLFSYKHNKLFIFIYFTFDVQIDKINPNVDDNKDITENQENNVIDNQNNENIDRENQTEGQQNGINEFHSTDNNTANGVSKKKKSKKRMLSETVEEQTEQPVSKKQSENVSMEEKTEEPVLKKKSKNTVLSESSINQCPTTEKSTFDWKSTILEIVQIKGEISLKKLQKKVISRYMNFCSNTVTNEKARVKFNKKLKKVSGIVISDEKVKLT